MRGSNGGLTGSKFGKGGRAKASATQEETDQFLEEQNNAHLKELGSMVKDLKGVVVDIGDTVDEQSKFLETLQNSMRGATRAVKGTIGRIDDVMKSGGSKHLCILIAFSLFVLVGLYYLIKSKS
eukprot:TRINITY_DN229_c1_g1_i2.p1 TRINITY_DN229_c1_g1~~TRINITY_DN229_c1_g1_i2.p1  ORF type:complete len:124 (+),score=10.64 TRINITY_DN229_c1_g1_i2:35-406(+)